MSLLECDGSSMSDNLFLFCSWELDKRVPDLYIIIPPEDYYWLCMRANKWFQYTLQKPICCFWSLGDIQSVFNPE